MAVRSNNPFEASFENLTTATKQAKKTIVADVKQQVTGQEPSVNRNAQAPSLMQQLGLKEMPKPEKQEADQKQKQLLNETRQNLAKINAEVEEARRKKIKAQEARLKEEQEKKQQKKAEEKKKQEDPAWLKALRGKTGSQEGPKNVSG